MRPHPVTAIAIAALLFVACGSDGDSPSASVSLTSPDDGATVSGAIEVQMTASGLTIEEAGEVRDDAGHYHVIADSGCVEEGAPIAKDADHVHFGGGQDSGAIYLEPGTHELCLQVGDGVHTALDVTDRITITVAIASRQEWCAVMEQLDTTITEADRTADFAAMQLEFEKAARLAGQLDDGNEFIDDDARADVRAALAFAVDLAGAFTTAETEADAFEAAEALYADAPGGFETELPGADWISKTCGIDLEG